MPASKNWGPLIVVFTFIIALAFIFTFMFTVVYIYMCMHKRSCMLVDFTFLCIYIQMERSRYMAKLQLHDESVKTSGTL